LIEKLKTQATSDSSQRWILEWVAVLSNLSFTVLYMNQSEWSFTMGILGPLFLLILSWREKLYAEPVLQVVYIVSAVVGWLNVQGGWSTLQLSLKTHLMLFLLSTGLALPWGFGLKRYTSANFPLMDALMASWGMLATWLMMYQIHECWLYLIAVNVLSFFMYFKRRLFAAAIMFAIYFILSIDGYFRMHWFEL
jgi:nicotinamide mononucleotide transporter PnuC